MSNRLFLFLFCSIMGTETWCQGDCKEKIKHDFPNECPQRKSRRGIRELFSLKGTIFSIAIGSIIGVTINKFVFIEVNNVWEYEDVKGEYNNKHAEFRIAIVTQEYRWKFAKTDSIETGLLDIELPKLLTNLADFEEVKGTISVGCASQEGNKKDEIERAELRADNILRILRQDKNLGKKGKYKLNLGQFQTRRKTDSASSKQRRVIIIGILEKDPRMNGVEVGKALQNALQASSLKTTVNVDSYSNFDFSPMQ